ncbi:Mbov_0396 family ICE element transmembrane protein [Mycoplasma seminis]|uniref:Uncharacterized protein n=1 Tax=Mycoplasma seminis TaxID=512749 RepID=A0ABY9H9E2_9MOLU|nr:hypothetical protein [Mycoplasma seminis]WLP85209.1 hypothetical protein Q8852_02715 [Mycoplasma seminis]
MFGGLYYGVYSAFSTILVGLPLKLITVIVQAYQLIAIDLPQYILFGVRISDGISGAEVPLMFVRFVIVSLVMWVFMVMLSVVRMHYAKMDGSDNYVRIALKRSAVGTLYLIGIPVILFVANMLIALVVGVILGNGGNSTLSDTIWSSLYDKRELQGRISMEDWNSWSSLNTSSQYTIPRDFYDKLNWGEGVQVIITGAMIALGTIYCLVLGIMLVVGKVLQMFWLFMISPFVVSASIMDDGKRIKIWRTQYIGKQLSILAFFVGIQIYVQFVARAGSYINALDDVGFLLKILLSVALYVGGALAMQNFGAEVSSFIGESASIKEGMQDMKSVITGGRMLGKMGGLALAGAGASVALGKKAGDIGRFGLGANGKQLALDRKQAIAKFKKGEITRSQMHSQIRDAKVKAFENKQANKQAKQYYKDNTKFKDRINPFSKEHKALRDAKRANMGYTTKSQRDASKENATRILSEKRNQGRLNIGDAFKKWVKPKQDKKDAKAFNKKYKDYFGDKDGK